MYKLAADTFVISLARDVERRAAFQAQARAVDLVGWSYFDAFDGASSRLMTGNPSPHGRPGRLDGWPLLAGEIGCALSHIAIWRAMRHARQNTLCILEDDVEFLEPETFWDRLKAFFSALPPKAVALHLSGEVEKADRKSVV